MIEFDSGTKNTGLNGGLGAWCTSKKIARRLEGKTRDVLARKKTADAKYKELENGPEANQWANLEKNVERTGREIKKLQLELNQEKEIASSLGLGAWCKRAKRRRKHAESALQEAENALGKVQGRINILKQKQTAGIDRANEIIASNNQIIDGLKKQIQAVKTKIANYKIERDNIKRAEAQTQAQAQANASVTATKVNSAGILSKKNLPIIAGTLFLGSVLYFFKNGKKTTTIKRKKVTKKVSA